MRVSLMIAALLAATLLFGCEKGEEQATTESPQTELQALHELKAGAVDYYRARRGVAGDAAAARDETVAWLLEQEGVQDAGVAEDGETIWVKLATGVEFDMIAE